VILQAAEFVSLEKLCCPFLNFEITVEAENGSVWLKLTGREGVKAFVREEISALLGTTISIEENRTGVPSGSSNASHES